MFTAAYLTTSLVVLAVGRRYLFKGRFPEEAKTMMRMGLGMVAILAPLQVLIGDQHGLNTLKHQPAKVAAIESHWDGSKPGALVLFAIPNEKEERNDFEIAIPYGASLILTHKADGLFPGLKEFAPNDRPPVLPVFLSFRLMVGMGVLMLLIGFVGAWLWLRGRLFDTRWYLQYVQYAWPLGFIAILAGWYTTEIGRQPWIATGILRTADAASPVSGGRGVHDADPVRHRLRHRVLDGHLLHQPPDRVRPQGKPRPSRPTACPPPAHRRRAGRARSDREDLTPWTRSPIWLPVVWAAIIGIAVALYVILDGFDLGLGILFPFTPEEERRDVMMNSVAPFWDGNETWLVLGGGGLLVAFPLAYAVIMPALYLPIIIMLLGLIFRGVAFEFRWTAKPSHEFWDNAFAYGSIVATFMQGVVLGGYLQGINVQNNQFAGGTFDWLAPFPLFTGWRSSSATRCSARPGWS